MRAKNKRDKKQCHASADRDKRSQNLRARQSENEDLLALRMFEGIHLLGWKVVIELDVGNCISGFDNHVADAAAVLPIFLAHGFYGRK